MLAIIWSFLARFLPCYALCGGICPHSDAADLPPLPQPRFFTSNGQRTTSNEKINFANSIARHFHHLLSLFRSQILPKKREKTCIWPLINPQHVFAPCFSPGISPPSVVAHHVINYRQTRGGGLGATGTFRYRSRGKAFIPSGVEGLAFPQGQFIGEVDSSFAFPAVQRRKPPLHFGC